MPFRAGEVLHYDVGWSNYLTAGTATVAIREKKPVARSLAYYIVAEGRPTGLLARLYTAYYKADTLLDAYTLLPERGSIYSEEGSRRKLKTTRFNQERRTAHFEVTGTSARKEVALPAQAQDALSAVYALRVLPLRQGLDTAMWVSDAGHVFRVQVRVAGRETISTPIGTLPAWRVVPVITDEKALPAGRALAIWISDDSRRLPLRMDADLPVGTFRLLLRSVSG